MCLQHKQNSPPHIKENGELNGSGAKTPSAGVEIALLILYNNIEY